MFLRKVILFVPVLLICLGLSGCVAMLAAAAGGAGTAVWLSGKLVQEVNAPLGATLQAVKKGLDSCEMKINKETVKVNVAQVISHYSDGSMVWIDIHRVSADISRISIRVGALGNKESERYLLDRILPFIP